MNDERRMEREAVLRCETCKQEPYIIYRRQNLRADGALSETYGHVIWPAHPDVPPPLHPEKITCRCGGALRRVAA